MNKRKLLGFIFIILGLASVLTIVLMPNDKSNAIYVKLAYIIPPFCLLASYFTFRRKKE